ncbi:MAG: amino acid carrier protein [Chlamydiia bacterium]
MDSKFFWVMNEIDTFFWGFVAFFLILLLGLYFTVHTRAFQIRALAQIIKTFCHFLRHPITDQKGGGVHPIRLFFTSVGGMVGIGNVVGIVTAVQFGGPGALFWVWVTGIVGSVIKYAEIYLGFKYRIPKSCGNGYQGGPVHVLKEAFKYRVFPVLVAFFLCLYCAEIYQFTVMVESISFNYSIDKSVAAVTLMGLILYVVMGGVDRVTKYCMYINPVMMLTYLFMCFWVIFSHIPELPALFKNVFYSAFNGHAAVGGFAGSSILMTIRYGVGRAAYSSDIGMGYDSSMQVESRVTHPENQAKLAIFGVYIDNFICTVTLIVVLLSGVWQMSPMVDPPLAVQAALTPYFPFVKALLPLFFFVAGFTTIVAYFSVGLKTAQYLSPLHGKKAYVLYGLIAMPLFCFLGSAYALLMISLSGAGLLILNLIGIYRLRRQVVFIRDIKQGDSMGHQEPILDQQNSN